MEDKKARSKLTDFIIGFFIIFGGPILSWLFMNYHGYFVRFDWDTIVLKDVLPETTNNIGNILENTEDELWLEVGYISKDEYLAYIDACETQKGFNIETSLDDGPPNSLFKSFNQEGYKIDIFYDDSAKSMRIALYAPDPMTEFILPDFAIEMGLPIPKSNLGCYHIKGDDSFMLIVGDMTRDDCREYIDLCIDSGFCIEPYYLDDFVLYTALNEQSYKIRIKYAGYNRMLIQLQPYTQK